ncbi:MAG: hypothetical protein GQ470_03725 [Gammaproteobacteria bacterium]|nr:hypothetical protein [Gammaproteobacteria bacterium]
MKKILSISVAMVTLLYLQGAAAAFKCWTNSDGYRECGNTIPPEYAQQETRTMDDRGMTTDVQKRAKTRDEIQEGRRIAKEQKIRAAEERKRKEEQDRKDRVLLATFLKAEEILTARDRNLAVYEGYIELSLISIGKLNRKLKSEQERAANFERNGKSVPESLMKKIDTIRGQLADKEGFIRKNESEMALLNKKYGADYERFIELKGGRK